MNTATDTLIEKLPVTAGEGAALTAQLTTLLLNSNGVGTPDYSPATVITAGWGQASAQEAITQMYVIQNLQIRLAEVEARLEAINVVVAN